MKRFALFSGEDYYPGGGWRDFQESFNSVEEAYRFLIDSNEHRDWYHVVDLTTREILNYLDFTLIKKIAQK